MEPEIQRTLRDLILGLETKEDLRIVSILLRGGWSTLAEKEVNEFRTGDRVTWSHGSRLHSGTVEKPNKKDSSLFGVGGTADVG